MDYVHITAYYTNTLGCHTLSAAQNEHCWCKVGRQVVLLTTQQP